MNRSSRLLAGCAVVIATLATGALTSSPAEAQWRPYWRPFPPFHRPIFYPRPFLPRPIIFPRPIVYRPIFVPPPPPIYTAYVPPPPVIYSAPYKKRVVHRHYRKVSKRTGCNCPAQPAAAPAPAPAPEQPPAKGS